jgi:hypothetical protein
MPMQTPGLCRAFADGKQEKAMELILAYACGAATTAGLMLALKYFRPRREIIDWTEEAYNKPRAITRIHSNNFDWEIK